MEIKLNVESITVVKSATCDTIYLHMVSGSMESGMFPWKQPPIVTLRVAYGIGAAYCARNFPGIPIEVVLSSSRTHE